MTGEPASQTLTVEELVVKRGDTRVVHGVDLVVPPGEITALLGANGAGKSSIVLALGGLLKPAAGRIRLGERDLTGLAPEKVRRAGVAIVAEGRRSLRSMTVADNLAVVCYGLPPAETKARMGAALALFPELTKRLDVATGLLSGGEQQMVVIAQGLLSRPALLVVDELSLGLAPTVVKRLLRALEDVAGTGVGILLIEQFANLALRTAATAYVLAGGRIRYRGSAVELRDDPGQLARAYLS